ncbi:TetR/AcrR family transcriptional regulator [Amycolatopsis suaedae]|uniref:TetR/AcrR family transcriptional regulator n=1 Tax=Amycolatopsis suaedae TaxID=2510978 RepID=UPI001F101A4E|nr:TetR/AcrR family transcriptional regulator [Amycolatopsis suaedae]
MTRQRVLDEALRLFAERGYAATSVADIQVACGLAPGSGALYKHFPSKRALLEHAVRRNLDTVAGRSDDAVAELPAEPAEALRLMAEVVWATMDGERNLIRIMIREFDVFPELFEPMWDTVVAAVYRRCADWVTALAGRGITRVEDPEATAAVLVASLTYFPILDVLIGRTPGDVGKRRFLDAWLAHAARTLGLEA